MISAPAVVQGGGAVRLSRSSLGIDDRMVAYQGRRFSMTLAAEARFEKAVGALAVENWGEVGFEVKASAAFMDGRRRIEAAFHNPGVSEIQEHLKKVGKGFMTIAEAITRYGFPVDSVESRPRMEFSSSTAATLPN